MLNINIWVRVGNDSKIFIDRDIAGENPWEWMKPLTDVAHLQHSQSLLYMPFSYEWFIYIHLRKFIANFSIFVRTSRKENVDPCGQKILLCKQLEKLWFFFSTKINNCLDMKKSSWFLSFGVIFMLSFQAQSLSITYYILKILHHSKFLSNGVIHIFSTT